MDLPVVAQSDKAHLLIIEKTWLYINTKILSLDELMSNLLVAKENKILKQKLADGKENDKGKSFDRSKVWALICDGCGTPWCVYSNKMVGATCGPTVGRGEYLNHTLIRVTSVYIKWKSK